MVRNGEVEFAAAHKDPVDGAILIFNVDDTSPIEDFLSKDPYVKNKLVTDYFIRELAVAPKNS